MSAPCNCPDPARPLYTGWYRPNRRHRWERICQDADRRRCLQRLLEARPAGEFIVRFPDDENPNLERTVAMTTDDTTTTEPTTWVAWQRIPPAKVWEKVCESESEEGCRALFWARPWQGSFRDVCFTTKDPNRRFQL
jgi:hypothetical protein